MFTHLFLGSNAHIAYLRDPDGHKICAFCQLAA